MKYVQTWVGSTLFALGFDTAAWRIAPYCFQIVFGIALFFNLGECYYYTHYAKAMYYTDRVCASMEGSSAAVHKGQDDILAATTGEPNPAAAYLDKVAVERASTDALVAPPSESTQPRAGMDSVFPIANQGRILSHFPTLAHRDDVDGLRAVAVMPVVFYHFDVSFPGGFAGVDIFFVVSGFLITSILLSKLDQGSFSLAEFWGRRCRRLFPAMAAMLTVTFAAGWFLLLGETYSELLLQGTATLLLSANLRLFAIYDSYFTTDLDSPLLHCWSLAVEEHFYLLFPLFLACLWRYARRSIFAAQAVLAAFSLVLSLVLTPIYPNFSFYLLPTRASCPAPTLAALVLCALSLLPSSLRLPQTWG